MPRALAKLIVSIVAVKRASLYDARHGMATADVSWHLHEVTLDHVIVLLNLTLKCGSA
jgi:hypothetical protein